MKIHELAQKVGMTAAAIRFYEKEGLLDRRHVRRAENNYREYFEEAVTHLRTIKNLQSAGFTLTELRQFTFAEAENQIDLQKIIEVTRQRIMEIDKKKAELERAQAHLERILAHKIQLLTEQKEMPE
ncbi:MerR family transcriptional regulator [Paenibacillus macerans]|uniref:MerR family transcriptional regulator n=1 Tax=Paenibacillus macerans TaxID=44252 RepID=A0A6N8EXS7_PAEMA|nr:MerR family transcriptional regulator [Paenibacillus macerans]MED4957706.1 MerR family transcriptional regulator [Paenibacillus macerans]MUG24629.1 MerR family transcriptional regulator [Paenibacillus macerans]UMV45791.1 MerR family transcriptional regulator [Paenibacillus macerans]